MNEQNGNFEMKGPQPDRARRAASARTRLDYVHHVVEKGTCDSCFARVGKGDRKGVVFRDERVSCAKCQATAVVRISEGRQILQHVSRVLERVGGLEFEGAKWIRLELRSQEQLIRDTGSTYATRPRGSANLSHDSGVATYAVRSLYGLPREAFADICAHELGHIYMFRRKYPELEPLVEEGLCRLCQYVYLKDEGSTASLARIDRMWQSDNPVYGAGFRAAHRALGARRLVALMEEVRQLGKLP